MANFWELQDEALGLMNRIETFRPEGIRILLEALDREQDFDAVFKMGITDYFTRMINSIYGERRLTAFLAKVRKYDEQRSGMYKCFGCGHTTDFAKDWRQKCPACEKERLTAVGKFYDLLNIGKDKWLWLAWECWEERWIFEPENIIEIAEGIEPSREAALKKINDLLGDVRWFGQNYRAKTKREEISKAWWASRANHEATDAKAIEYLYRLMKVYPSIAWEEVPIIKRTKKRVYIRAREWDERATILDREKLERDDSAWGGRRRGWKDEYFTRAGRDRWEAEQAGRIVSNIPECFQVLGVSSIATLQDIKRAYRRRAQETHPDAGGDSNEFIKVQEAYEQAKELLRQRAN